MREPRWPLPVALIGAAAYIGLITIGGIQPAGDSAAAAALFLVTLVGGAGLSLVLGLRPRRRDSVLGVLVIVLALQWNDLNPFPAAVMIGFWLVGLLARSHHRLAHALSVRAFELDAGREAHLQEALRHERTQIARELHDIVAHSLSVIVIQASAGQRLAVDDPRARDLLQGIADTAGQVRGDMAGLGRLLDSASSHAQPAPYGSIDDLLERTRMAGSPVTYSPGVSLDEVPVAVRPIIYRIVQEGVTNAIKHAPGAAIDVSIARRPSGASISVEVINAVSHEKPLVTRVPGARRGIIGANERVTSAGGTLTSGPDAHGGWSLRAQLPL